MPFSDKDDYFATQYISDLIRKYGYDGICHHSSKAKGKNYTIFNCSEENIEFVKSELVLCKAVQYSLVDLNSCNIIDIKPENKVDMDKISDVEQKNIQELKDGIITKLLFCKKPKDSKP